MNNSIPAYSNLPVPKLWMSSKLQLNFFKTVSSHLNKYIFLSTFYNVLNDTDRFLMETKCLVNTKYQYNVCKKKHDKMLVKENQASICIHIVVFYSI